MRRLINYKNSFVASSSISWHRLLHLPAVLLWETGRTFQGSVRYSTVKSVLCLFVFVTLCLNSFSQRQDILLNENWQTVLVDQNISNPFVATPNSLKWKKVSIPHNWDDYHGYRRLVHGNLHGDAVYKRTINIKQSKTGRRFFLFFEGVGSYATVFLNNRKVGEHNGGRTTFTIDVTAALKTDGSKNVLLVQAFHPANIKDQPWVCGGCSDERGFSEGSQPLGIFRPVHLIVTNDVRIEPFGVHAWADIKDGLTDIFANTTIKNYSVTIKTIKIKHLLVDALGNSVTEFISTGKLKAKDSAVIKGKQRLHFPISFLKLWSVENPYLYKIISTVTVNDIVVDKMETDFGFRTVKWNNPSHQFTLNDKPIFINGIAEYEHLLGQSHAFSNEQIRSRIKWIQAAGFNAFRDGHQPHNLLYGKLCNEKGILWWTQLSAHVWYDTKEFRDNFKQLLKEWVIERRNDPSVILWGLQNESKLPKDFAEECTALIRSLDPTASTQRLVTTCNGGEGTDWDVPQNWTGTYGGNPATYGEDLKKQILVGEYGAWRTIDLHSEGGFKQNGVLSEDRMTLLMEQKIRLAEKVKDSLAGHFFWLLTSHDNPGRVQGGEGVRELDRIGPVNYKGLLTPWEEPTDAFYMYRSNYADKNKEPMVYIVSHTWPNRWMTPGIKDSIIVYSNCDEVELFNDIDNASLGKQKRNGRGTHFQWDKVNIQYNVLYAVGYVNGKVLAKDTITLFHLPQSPHFNKLYANAKNITKPQSGYNYVYLVNCGGPDYTDKYGTNWQTDRNFVSSWTKDFPELPKDFASQRRTVSPIRGTNDWKLFQTFRYGKEKLKYEFDVSDGEYLVELYFIEPWLGVGGGMEASGMRLFDVAVNGKTVLNDLDIWTEAGTNTALKKVVKAKSVNGKIIISFPESKAGQAVISAIAIAELEDPFLARKTRRRVMPNTPRTWLDIGDKQFWAEETQINSLPPNLFGSSWIKLNTRMEVRHFEMKLNSDMDFYIAVSNSENKSKILEKFENTLTTIVTDENGGTVYRVYKKRFINDDTISVLIDSSMIVCFQPANNMQPAYDLKPITQYKANIVKLSAGAVKDSANGRYCSLVKTNNEVIIEYPIQVGAADIYSITMKYFYGEKQSVVGKLQLIDAGNTMMLEEPVSFTFTREGKWNQFTINTGSQINAGNYKVRLVIEKANGLAISGIDVQ